MVTAEAPAPHREKDPMKPVDAPPGDDERAPSALGHPIVVPPERGTQGRNWEQRRRRCRRAGRRTPASPALPHTGPLPPDHQRKKEMDPKLAFLYHLPCSHQPALSLPFPPIRIA
ncbi:hypothetical protein D9615_002150 [Tricholomella constricta]|uniref:Uncharacterized protein n=1 Tax=Tricholomella constricta TaxID=117010 RepID=A0A8H5HQ86_9AGAR|nr:hypothetical protein D9615_002150 [Tricholomella constricta]